METKEGIPEPKKPVGVKKGSQELAAQIKEVPNVYMNEFYIPRAEEVNEQYKEWRNRVDSLLAKDASDEDIQRQLDWMYEEGNKAGMYKPTEGAISDENIQFTKDKLRGYGYAEEDLDEGAKEQLRRGGYLHYLRLDRRMDEKRFNDRFEEFSEKHPLNPEEEKERVDALLARTLDLNRLTPDQTERLRAEFPGGNFLYHGTNGDQAVSILDDGELVSFKIIYERYQKRKEEETEENHIYFPRRNSGYEGVSWSFNGIGALPGDRYHIVGFLGAPNRVLTQDQQLAIPSRPSPHELLQISGGIDAPKYYSLKTKHELINYINPLGEGNSVLGNIVMLNSELRRLAEGQERIWDEPLLLAFLRENTDEQILDLVRNQFTLGENGNIEFSPDLLQQPGGEKQIPVAAVWFQTLIDSGRIRNIPGFEDSQNVRQIVERINLDNFTPLVQELRKDNTPLNEELENEESNINDVRIDIENLYFVTSRKDLQKWLRLIAGCGKQPRGILVYDHNRVKLEHFASEHRGDNEALTEQFKLGIRPDVVSGWIDWEKQVLQEDITPDKLVGYQKHVVAEKFLNKRRSIKLSSNGDLMIE